MPTYWQKMTCKISIYYPDNGDFNDMLMNGDQVRELVFYKKQQVAA
jgi:putative DNA primase/helicase